MQASIWYEGDEKRPDKSGYYLAYRGWGMGGAPDGASDYGYLYFSTHQNAWYEYESDSRSRMKNPVSFVYYWTTADPYNWVHDKPSSFRIGKTLKPNPTLDDAWREVEKAVEKYNILKKLIE